MSRLGEFLWLQKTVGLGPAENVVWMKFCISVGLAKVNVGLLLRVMKTLLELVLILPTWTRVAAFDAVSEEPLPVSGMIGTWG